MMEFFKEEIGVTVRKRWLFLGEKLDKKLTFSSFLEGML